MTQLTVDLSMPCFQSNQKQAEKYSLNSQGMLPKTTSQNGTKKQALQQFLKSTQKKNKVTSPITKWKTLN